MVRTGLLGKNAKRYSVAFGSIALLLCLVSCGGGNGTQTTTTTGTPPGTFSITVTATSAASHSSALNIDCDTVKEFWRLDSKLPPQFSVNIFAPISLRIFFVICVRTKGNSPLNENNNFFFTSSSNGLECSGIYTSRYEITNRNEK